MNHSLNSLKGVEKGIIYGTTLGLIKGDTRSLDYSSYASHAILIWGVAVTYTLSLKP